jgi:hypothetical protein
MILYFLKNYLFNSDDYKLNVRVFELISIIKLFLIFFIKTTVLITKFITMILLLI